MTSPPVITMTSSVIEVDDSPWTCRRKVWDARNKFFWEVTRSPGVTRTFCGCLHPVRNSSNVSPLTLVFFFFLGFYSTVILCSMYHLAHLWNWLHKKCRSSAGSWINLPCTLCQSLPPPAIQPVISSFNRATTHPWRWCRGFNRSSIRGTSLQLIAIDALRLRWLFLSSLFSTSCHVLLSTFSQGVALSIDPLHALGGDIVAPLELSTLGYRLAHHGWLWFVFVFVSQNCLKTAL